MTRLQACIRQGQQEGLDSLFVLGALNFCIREMQSHQDYMLFKRNEQQYGHMFETVDAQNPVAAG